MERHRLVTQWDPGRTGRRARASLSSRVPCVQTSQIRICQQNPAWGGFVTVQTFLCGGGSDHKHPPVPWSRVAPPRGSVWPPRYPSALLVSFRD